MQASPSLDVMVRDPVGRFFSPSPNALVWCQSPALCGAVAWGCPSARDVEQILALFEGYRSAVMAPRFDTILDGRGIEAIDPDGFALLLRWLEERQTELTNRVHLQIGVIARQSMLGVTLTGILPTLGETHAFRVVSDPALAFRELSPLGDELWQEVERAVAAVRGVPDELRRLRELLFTQPEGASLAEIARSLHVAERTLQRQLQQAGTTFRDEVRDARFSRAQELLRNGNDKVSTIARRVGLSQGALTLLIREKTGCTPAELRRSARLGKTEGGTDPPASEPKETLASANPQALFIRSSNYAVAV